LLDAGHLSHFDRVRDGRLSEEHPVQQHRNTAAARKTAMPIQKALLLGSFHVDPRFKQLWDTGWDETAIQLGIHLAAFPGTRKVKAGWVHELVDED